MDKSKSNVDSEKVVQKLYRRQHISRRMKFPELPSRLAEKHIDSSDVIMAFSKVLGDKKKVKFVGRV